MFLHRGLNASFAYVKLAHSYLRDDIDYSVFFSPVFFRQAGYTRRSHSRRRDMRHYKNTRFQFNVLEGISPVAITPLRQCRITGRRVTFSAINAAGTLFRGDICIVYIRVYAKRHYNAPGSSLFRIAYTLDTFSPLFLFLFFSPLFRREMKLRCMQQHCPRALLSFSFTLALFSSPPSVLPSRTRALSPYSASPSFGIRLSLPSPQLIQS